MKGKVYVKSFLCPTLTALAVMDMGRYTVRFIVYVVESLSYSAMFLYRNIALYNKLSTTYTIHRTVCTVHRKVRTIHFTLYTVHYVTLLCKY